MITQKKINGKFQKFLFFSVTEISPDLLNHISKLLKSLEDEDAWYFYSNSQNK